MSAKLAKIFVITLLISLVATVASLKIIRPDDSERGFPSTYYTPSYLAGSCPMGFDCIHFDPNYRYPAQIDYSNAGMDVLYWYAILVVPVLLISHFRHKK